MSRFNTPIAVTIQGQVTSWIVGNPYLGITSALLVTRSQIKSNALASVITAKAANDYQFKTGQCEEAGTFMFYRVIPCRGKCNL